MEQLPKKNMKVIRLSRTDILRTLCDYFLGDDLEGFSDWSANLVEGEDGLEFVAVYGFEGDEVFEKARELINDLPSV